MRTGKIKGLLPALSARSRDLLARRPHRSFKRTYRRDYYRTLKLPGYVSFTNQVRKLIWTNKRLFLGLAAVYSVTTLLLVGLTSQSSFTQLASVLKSTSGDIFAGGWGTIGQAGLLLLSGATGSFSTDLGESQQLYAGFISIFLWMTVVWLLRAIMAGKTPKLRDGIYSSGAPFVSTMIVMLFVMLQCIPAALGVILYSSGLSTDLLSEGAVAMLIFAGAFLLIVLSAYLLVSSFFALIIVTLPGMYPWRAIRAAGDLVIGRRLRILYRIAWLIFALALGWMVTMFPIVILATWMQGVQQLAWIPLVPVALVVMSSVSLIFACAYVYLLYRKVVDDDGAPA